MFNSFGEYAKYYDLLYQDKNYAGEASFISRLLDRYLKKTTRHELLDLACGTGQHAMELARIGYVVEGSDLSADMVKVARDNVKEAGLNIKFYNESFQNSNRIDKKYDAVIAMFSAINYLTDYVDLAKTLQNIQGLLREGGVFIFDFWNGNAVIKNYSPVRTKRIKDGEFELLRITNTCLDPLSQIATLNFDFMLIRSGTIVKEFTEVHRVRYFFPQEMLDFLAANGYEILYRSPFFRDDEPLTSEDWNVTYVATPINTLS